MSKTQSKRSGKQPGPVGSGARDKAWRARVAGLPATVVRFLENAADAISARRLREAERALVAAMALAPQHVEVIRLRGVLCHLQGRYAEAVTTLRDGLALHPDDAMTLNNLGSALRADGDAIEAIKAFERASELQPGLAAVWYNLGKTLKSQARIEDAKVALQRSLELEPGHAAARMVLGDACKGLGEIDAAAQCYRTVLKSNPRNGQAWFALANLKTVRFTEDESAQLAKLINSGELSDEDRIAMGFTRVKALEDAGQFAEAYAALASANALKRKSVTWDAKAHSAWIDRIAAAFAQPVAAASPEAQGSEVIFVVSLPRSGSTLTEQILSAHSQVEGASELPDLPAIIEEESRRRGHPYPGWVGDASPEDWARLGQAYLDRTARWREQRPRFTDKGLSNWAYVGAIMAMLPQARVVICRRDPLETCFSCFQQLFARGQDFSYAIEDVVAYWRDFDRLSRLWANLFPGRAQESVYEHLVDDPETAIFDLLAFCGLPLEVSCLSFHTAERVVRTASAAQVRQPMRRDTARAPRYGQALDPLRNALSGTAVGSVGKS